MIDASYKRRWGQFTLRTLLLLTTVMAVWLGLELRALRERDATIRALQAKGVDVTDHAPSKGLRSWLARAAGLYAGRISPNLNCARNSLDETDWVRIGSFRPKSFSMLFLSASCPTDKQLATIAPACDPVDLWAEQGRLTDRIAPILASWHHLSALNLNESPGIGDAVVESLKNHSRLQSLMLSGTAVNGRGFAAWGANRTLKTLWLQGTQIDNEGLKPLVQLRCLEELKLGGNAITDAGLAPLGQLTSLVRLNLDGCKLTGEGFRSLTALQRLDVLSVAHTHVNDAGLELIARFSHVSILDLRRTEITDAGIAELSRMPNLAILDLSSCRLSDAAVESLAKLQGLTSLGLGETELTDDGLLKLAALTKLIHLSVVGTNVTSRGILRFKSLLPAVEVDD